MDSSGAANSINQNQNLRDPNLLILAFLGHISNFFELIFFKTLLTA